jgi:type IV pilus biogenesis/stability protein PilW
MKSSALIISVLLGTLGGCVSQSTVVEDDRVAMREANNVEAARTRMVLGLNYLERGDNVQALFNLEKAKSLDPKSPEVYNALAYYYQRVGEFSDAEDAYRDALSADSDNADTYNNYGSLLCQRGKYEQAEKLLLAAVKRPGYIRVSESYENLALCKLAQDDFDAYRSYLQLAIQHGSNRAPAVYRMAELEYAVGDLNMARRLSDRLQNLGQVAVESSLLRYLIAYQMGDDNTMREMENFILTVYQKTPQAAMVLQRDFKQSSPEILKQRYKNILIGSNKPSIVEAASASAAPKLKIVKRKSPNAVTSSSIAATPLTKPEPLPTAQVNDLNQADELRSAALADSPAEAATSSTIPMVMASNSAANTASVPASSSQDAAASDSGDATTQDSEVVAAIDKPEPLPADTNNLTTNLATLNQSAATETTKTSVVSTATSSATPVPTQPVSTQDGAVSRSDRMEQNTKTQTALSASPSKPTVVNNTAVVTPAASTADANVHIVKAGDTLYSIATRHRLTVSELQALNKLDNASFIVEGQRLLLGKAANVTTPPTTYQVQAGDSIFSIAYKFQLKAEQIVEWNQLQPDQALTPGQTIYLQDSKTISP